MPKKRLPGFAGGHGRFAGGAPDYARLPPERPRLRADGTRRTLKEILAARTTPSSRARARARFGSRGGIGTAIAYTNPPNLRLPNEGRSGSRQPYPSVSDQVTRAARRRRRSNTNRQYMAGRR